MNKSNEPLSSGLLIFGMTPGFALTLVLCTAALGITASVTVSEYNKAQTDHAAEASGAEEVLQFEQMTRRSLAESAVPWIKYSVPYPAGDPSPRVSIILTDDGTDPSASQMALSLPKSITFAVSPRAKQGRALVSSMRESDHEVLLWLPMTADEIVDTSPNPIASHVSQDELMRRIGWNLAQLDDYIGVMNAFGETTTQDPTTMRTLMGILSEKGLGFIDSVADRGTVAGAMARRLGIPAGDIVVAIENGADRDTIKYNLSRAVLHAEKWGTAIVTMPISYSSVKTLKNWIELPRSTVKLTPLTTTVKRLRSGSD